MDTTGSVTRTRRNHTAIAAPLLAPPMLDRPATALAPAKLRLPHLRADLLPRPRLHQRLDSAANYPVTLVVAPVGFGKTTLLGSWAASSSLPVSWLTLQSSDNDPQRFYSYLASACEQLTPGGSRAFDLTLLPSAEATLAPQLAALDALPGAMMLVLDDIHLITSPDLHAALAALIEHLPPNLHLVLAGRYAPPLPLARLRARGRLLELHAGDLRFTPAESRAFLATVPGPNNNGATLDRIDEEAEGWPAALQLLAAGLDGRADMAPEQVTHSREHSMVLELLAGEVFDAQPAHVRSFLLATAIADRFSPALSTALLPDDLSPSFSPPSILADLQRRDLFLVPLDETRQWYRYSHLFAAMLRLRLEELGASAIRTLHNRAALWFANGGFYEEAGRHALALGGAFAAEMIARIGSDALRRGEIVMLRSWIGALDAADVEASPRLSMLRAAVDLWSADFGAAETALNRVSLLLAQNSDVALADDLAMLGSALACAAGDWGLAPSETRSLSTLRREGWSCPHLGGRCSVEGRCALTDPTYVTRWHAELMARAETGGDWLTLTSAALSLSQLQIMCGQIGAAALTLNETLALIEAANGPNTVLADLVRMGFAGVHYARNEIQAAEAVLAPGLRQIEARGFELFRPFADSERSLLAAVRGDVALARSGLDGIARGIRRISFGAPSDQPVCSNFLQLRQVEVWLALGDTAAAARWAVRASIPLDRATSLLDLMRQYALAQVLVGCWPCTEMVAALLTRTQAGPLPLAQKLLASCASAFEQYGYDGLLLDVLTLQAVTYQLQSETTAAHEVILRALALAAAEGHVRSFLMRGRPMVALLISCASRRVPGDPLRAYALELLESFPADERSGADSSADSASTLAALEVPAASIEPLSSRETDVLRLLATGQNSREIAATLTLAVDTVRTHTKNIYGKLDAHNRVEALTRARALRLI